MASTLYPADATRPFLAEVGPGAHQPVVVVGIVGQPDQQTANRLADLPAFCVPAAPGGSSQLLMRVDRERGMVYLVHASAASAESMLDRAEALAAADDAQAAGVWLATPAADSLRALVVLFHLCHAVVIVSEARCADVRLLRTLRVLGTLRQVLQPAVAAALRSAGAALPSAPDATRRNPGGSVLPPIPTLGFVFAAAGFVFDKDDPLWTASGRGRQTAALEGQVRKLLASSKQLARCAVAPPRKKRIHARG